MGIGHRFLHQSRWQIAGLLFGILALPLGVWSVVHYLGPSPAVLASTHGQFICAQTLKPFALTITPGMTLPVPSPYSGKNTGYPAELCYWTSDGRIREAPVAVLLNSCLGKPGPTFCPDCGRLVRSRNPLPVPGSPPPTRQQFMHMEEE